MCWWLEVPNTNSHLTCLAPPKVGNKDSSSTEFSACNIFSTRLLEETEMEIVEKTVVNKINLEIQIFIWHNHNSLNTNILQVHVTTTQLFADSRTVLIQITVFKLGYLLFY